MRVSWLRKHSDFSRACYGIGWFRAPEKSKEILESEPRVDSRAPGPPSPSGTPDAWREADAPVAQTRPVAPMETSRSLGELGAVGPYWRMGEIDGDISAAMAQWLEAQPVFFVASAPLATEGLVNCSPKGNRREFVVLSGRRVAYLEQTGSGVETIAHLKENGRIVVMFCAFEGPPRIVRLHGYGRVVAASSPQLADLAGSFPDSGGVGVRSIIVVEVERLSDSCGYGVPFMEFAAHRPTMDQWAARKGRDGIRDYWRAKNRVSLDGLDGIVE